MAEHRAFSLRILLLASGVASFASGQTAWQKYNHNPVIVKDTTLAGIWEWAAIGQPALLRDNDTFKLWYAGAGVSQPGDTILRGRIFYAWSTDGIHWTKHGPPVLDVGPAGAWDSRWLDTPAVVRDSSGYKLFYYGDSVYPQASSALGVATSVDGIAWRTYDRNPVIKKSDSLLDWDGFWIESPAVLYDPVDHLYQMWYSGIGYGPGFPYHLAIRVGLATSGDGFAWTKDTLHNPVFDLAAAGAWDDAWVAVPAVRKIGGLYRMWYCGASTGDWKADSTLDTIRVGYATSPDGIHWTRDAGNPVLTSFDPPVDSEGPWAPDVVFDGKDYLMLYEAAAPSNRGNWICMARARADAVFENNPPPGIPELRVQPNPFRGRVTISTQYAVGNRQESELKIFTSAGRLVKTFYLTDYPSPVTTIIWDGTDADGRPLPAGIYFCEPRGAHRTAPFKLVLLR